MNAGDTAVRKTPPRGRWVGSETKVRRARTLTRERGVAMVLGAQSSSTVVGSEGLASPEAAAMALIRKRRQECKMWGKSSQKGAVITDHIYYGV